MRDNAKKHSESKGGQPHDEVVEIEAEELEGGQ